MIYRKLVSLICLAGCSFLANSSFAGDCDFWKEKELDEIRNAEKNKYRNVIIVKAFDRQMLLPNRYGVFIEKSNLTSFVSPPDLNYFEQSEEALKKKFGCFSGDISFGSYIEYSKMEEKRQGDPGWRKQFKKFKYKGFLVEKRVVDIENTDIQVITYLVHDNKTFMAISDTNRELWKAIIDSSEK